jgi:TrmH RNA methyltransferase
VYGFRAGLAVMATRPNDITEVRYGKAVADDLRLQLEEQLPRGVAVAMLPDREIEQAAQSAHHEGLCLFVRPRRWTAAAALADLMATRSWTAVALDRVRNPYNVGAILRTAAFFGVDAALLGSPLPQQALANDAVRVAEGGAEYLALCRTTDLADTLGRLRSRGIQVVGADVHSADGRGKPPKRRPTFRRPVVLVVGHEREGLSERVTAACDDLVAIPGRGTIESLNVAVAAGILMEKLVEARPEAPSPPRK